MYTGLFIWISFVLISVESLSSSYYTEWNTLTNSTSQRLNLLVDTRLLNPTSHLSDLWPANVLVYLPSSPPIHISGPITAHTSSEVISVLSGQAAFVDCDQTDRLSGTTQKYTGGWINGERKAVALVCFSGGGGECQEAEVTRGDLDPKQTERDWRESTSGCWSYCGGRTGWTGTDQLKLFNPHFQPGQNPDKTSSLSTFTFIHLMSVSPVMMPESYRLTQYHICSYLCSIKQQQSIHLLFMLVSYTLTIFSGSPDDLELWQVSRKHITQ